MTSRITLLFCLICITLNINAQKNVKLWDTPPEDNGLNGPEIIEGLRVSNISVAELYIYLPENNNTGMAVIICPGGGYSGLAMKHEGYDFAEWLNTIGIAGIVLKYRMPNKHKNIPAQDVRQAIQYIREHAKDMGIDTNKIGIAGFSAGGHLASTISTHFDTSEINIRPDFSILFYPVVTMLEGTHAGSRNNLLGANPSSEDLSYFSNELQVTAETPPAILFLSDDDKTVPPLNSYQYYTALKKYDIPSAMYIFPEGGHGWGMRDDFNYHNQMLALLEMWLSEINGKLIIDS